MKRSDLRLAALLGASLCMVPTAWAQTAPSAYTAGFRYDLSGRVVGTILPAPGGAAPVTYLATRSTYNASGFLEKVETGYLTSWQATNVAPDQWAGFYATKTAYYTYNSLGWRLSEKVVGADGSTASFTQYGYDAAGRLQCTAVRMNPAVYSSLPADACTQGTAGGNGPDRITKNVYDDAGQLLQVRKAVGTPIELADATYTYTVNGKRQNIIDANGNRAEMRYDGFDRQIRWVFPSTTKPGSFNSTTPAAAMASAGTLNESDYEAYTYDPNGNRLTLRKRDGSTLTYNYDALNRMVRKIVPERSGLSSSDTRDVYYGYDVRGLQTYARFDSDAGEGLTAVYDGLGRLSSSTNNMGGTARTLSYQRDGDGNRTRLTFPDGQYFTFEYDGLDRMVRIRENGGPEVANFSYNVKGERTGIGGAFNSSFIYDGISRLGAISHDMAGSGQDVTFCMGTMSGATCNPAYSPASQILNRTVSNGAYVWNGHANVNRNYTANGLNQYMLAGSAAFSYDPNGNLTSDGSTTYAYDIENRLVTASGATSASMGWDPMGRLYQTAGAAITRFLYDGDELVGEYDGSGNLLRRYIHGSGDDDPLVWYEGSGLGDRRHLRADQQGSVVAISNSAGNSIGLNSYDEYGIPGVGNIGRFAYTGQIRIPELGMYHYKARIYSPTLGRFLQTDPIGYDDQINLYAYVGNDPVNQGDPSGTSANCSGGRTGQGCTIAEPRAATVVTARTGAERARPQSASKNSEGQSPKNGEIVVTGRKNGNAMMANSGIPTPPFELPGGPYTAKPSTPGNRPGSFQGPKQPSGPRSQAQWVPPEAEGGPPGSKGYWKTQQPGQGWERYSPQGEFMTPDQAHPNPMGPSRQFIFLGAIGAGLCLLFCESPAY